MKARTPILIHIGVSLIIVTIMLANAVNEVQSDIFDISQREVKVDGFTFPGLYYDIDDNTSNEKLIFRLSNIDPGGASAILSDQLDADGNRGVTYTTEAYYKSFNFEPWGSYSEISFLGEAYFAAFDKGQTSSMIETNQLVPYLYEKSENSNLLANKKIDKILLNTDSERIFNSSSSLELKEGYELSIEDIDQDGRRANVRLSKEGHIVDSKIVQSPIENGNIRDETYYYKTNLGDIENIVIIAVHFDSIMSRSSSGEYTIRVDGIFQMSDTPVSFNADQYYDQMSIRNLDPVAKTIKMDNEDHKIILDRNKDILLMGNIYIHTADQSGISATNPLRYYIYKDM